MIYKSLATKTASRRYIRIRRYQLFSNHTCKARDFNIADVLGHDFFDRFIVSLLPVLFHPSLVFSAQLNS